jgi:hypothetical protein
MTNSLLSLKPSLLNKATPSRHGVPRNSRVVELQSQSIFNVTGQYTSF